MNSEQRNAYISVLKQKEQQTLQQLYQLKVKSKSKLVTDENSTSLRLVQFIKKLEIRRKVFQDIENAVHSFALQEIEQEKKVAFEIEIIREVQKQKHYSSLTFRDLHRNIVVFVNTERLTANSVDYEQWFMTFRHIIMSQKHEIRSETMTFKLYVSTEFVRTLNFSSARLADNFQRSHELNFILSWLKI